MKRQKNRRIGKIQSAYLNCGTASHDVENARHYIAMANKKEALVWLNLAIIQLTAAKGKLQ